MKAEEATRVASNGTPPAARWTRTLFIVNRTDLLGILEGRDLHVTSNDSLTFGSLNNQGTEINAIVVEGGGFVFVRPAGRAILN